MASVAALAVLVPGVPFPTWALTLLIPVVGIVAARVQQQRNDVFPREWAGYATAYFCWGSMGTLTLLSDHPATGTVAGVGIAVGYAVFAYAIVWFHRTRVVGVDRDWMIDATVVLTAVAILVWTNLGVTRLAAQRFAPLEQAALAIAALIHLSFVTLTIRVLIITRFRAIRPYLGATAALLSFVGSAISFVSRTSDAPTPVVSYALWTLAAVSLAAIPLMPPARYLRRELSRQSRPFMRFAMLALALLLGTGAVLWDRGPTVDETVPTGGVMLVSFLVMWRMHGLVTANEQGKRHMERLAEQQETLAELGRRSLERTDVPAFMEWATDRIRTALRVDHCAVLELASEDKHLRVLAIASDRAGPVSLSVLLEDATPPSRAATTGELVHVPDIREDDRFERVALVDGIAPVASVSAAITGTDGTCGVLVVSNDEPHIFGEDELEFIRGASDVLAVAVDRILREERIRHASLHDALTGLPNRALLFDRLDHALAGAARREGQVALLFIDLDNFKDVNDELGHYCGDQLLVEVARRMRAATRGSDTLSRFGGDEFVLLAEGVEDEATATRIAEHLSDALAPPVLVQGQQVHISASVGVAIAGWGENAEQLLRRADAAMYQAKQHGRARLELAVPAT